MADRGVAFLAVFAFMIVLFAAFVVGVIIADHATDEANELRGEVERQLHAACNEQLPGGNWSVANTTVDVRDLEDARNVTCRRGGQVERISVNVSIQLEG